MKKILVMNIGTELGGIEKSLIEFLRFITSKDCEVDLVLWKKRGPLFEKVPESVNIIENIGPGEFHAIVNSHGLQKIGKIINYIKFKIFAAYGKAWKTLPQMRGKYDIAISYCQNGYSPYYVIDKVSADKKYLWYHHGSYEKIGREKEKDRYYFEKYDAIISVSKANKMMLSKHFPELSEKIIVIHNLLNEKEICLKANEEIDIFNNKSGCRIVTVGRLSQEKGQLIAIEVARILKESAFEFFWVFVGDGPERERCDEKVREYHLESNCAFIGAQLNPYAYINQADIYVQTSMVEADPVTIQEAKILEKPIIASDIPAIREAMEGVVNGRICEINEEKFAKEICGFYEENKRKTIGNLKKDKIRRDSEMKISSLMKFENL